MKTNKLLVVEGMTCNHCKMRVERALSGVDGVKNVKIDLANGETLVTLSKDVQDNLLSGAVTNAGYGVKSIVAK
jgi:copper chaperone CopZ